MAFDIEQKKKEIEPEEAGKTIQIRDRVTKEPDPDTTWTVCGRNSETYAKAESWRDKEFRKIGGRDMTDKEKRLLRSGFVARCSKGFTGFVSSGQPLPFTTEQAARILNEFPYVRDQVEEAIGDAEGFPQASTS